MNYTNGEFYRENPKTNSYPELLNENLNPWFITGFSDAESYFSISVSPDIRAKTGFNVQLIFGINLHVKDTNILENIKKTLGAGYINKSKTKPIISYRVKDIKGLQLVINHFDNYPLISYKKKEYLIFKEAFNLYKIKSHLREEGLKRIIFFKGLLNKGLSESLKKTFVPEALSLLDPQEHKNFNILALPLATPLELSPSNKLHHSKEEYHPSLIIIPDPMWVSGFTSGDGSFYIKYFKTGNNTSLGLVFSITLAIKDKDLLISLFSYFNSYFKDISFLNYGDRTNRGIFYTNKTVTLKIASLSNISNIIIPFFIKNPVLGVKHLDFLDFKKVSDILISKAHLKPESRLRVLEEIKNIQDNMNSRRLI